MQKTLSLILKDHETAADLDKETETLLADNWKLVNMTSTPFAPNSVTGVSSMLVFLVFEKADSELSKKELLDLVQKQSAIAAADNLSKLATYGNSGSQMPGGLTELLSQLGVGK